MDEEVVRKVHVQTELGKEVYLVLGSGLENPVRDLKQQRTTSGRTGSFLCPTSSSRLTISTIGHLLG